MELNVAIDPEQINKMVSDAVLKSAIGKHLEAAINREVAKLGQSYDNPLDHVIRKAVTEMIREVVYRDHADAIKQKITEQLASTLKDDFLAGIIEKGLQRY